MTFLRPRSKWRPRLNACAAGDDRLWQVAVLFHMREALPLGRCMARAFAPLRRPKAGSRSDRGGPRHGPTRGSLRIDLQRDALLSAGVGSRHLTNLAAGDTSVGSTPTFMRWARCAASPAPERRLPLRQSQGGTTSPRQIPRPAALAAHSKAQTARTCTYGHLGERNTQRLSTSSLRRRLRLTLDNRVCPPHHPADNLVVSVQRA